MLDKRHISDPLIVNIRDLNASDLHPLLLEQTAEWRSELDWDFSRSADLVRQFTGAHCLNGAALLDRSEVFGYGYTGMEGKTASIWDIYIRRQWRDANTEQALLRLLLNSLIQLSDTRRIESQLMLAETSSAHAVRNSHSVRLFERLLMTLEENTVLPAGRLSGVHPFLVQPWQDHLTEAAGRVISFAYAGHVDAEINEHYRTPAAASRFVYNLVHFPGCAVFHPSASFIAFDLVSRQIAGISLASFIASDVAHIAELCVIPRFQGLGLGYELLRRSIETLRQSGAARISVTVTAKNEPALGLYTRFGFRETRRFYAYVWER